MRDTAYLFNLNLQLILMNILEKAQKILMQPVCNACLGRQFGQLLSGYGNEERGRMLRTAVAMSIDNEKEKNNLDMSNFSDYKFHNLCASEAKPKKCSVCLGLLNRLDSYIEKIVKKTGDYEFRTFLVGTKLSHDLISREEELWERVGIDYCEPLKAETNREIGKLLEKRLRAKFDPKNPEINIILDLNSNKISIEVNPLFFYGEYQKLIRGIPQTRWPSGKYKTSIEQIIAKPFMLATKGTGHKLHGLGREDIDARCLAWRPFVLEIIKPKIRDINLRKLSKKIARSVRVQGLRFTSIAEVRAIKEAKLDKSYRATVACEGKITKKDLKKLASLVTEIRQKTPIRVLHRRADKFRRRKVKEIRTKFINSKKFVLEVKGEAGLYVKELISGDEGRTSPSVSELLGRKCVCRELDVIKIHKK